MTQKYLTDASVRAMLDKVDFVILPVLNVDGYSYTWKNPVKLLLWLYLYLKSKRKNIKEETDRCFFCCLGNYNMETVN